MKLTEWRQTSQNWLNDWQRHGQQQRRHGVEKKGNNIWLQMIGNFLSSLSIFHSVLPTLAPLINESDVGRSISLLLLLLPLLLHTAARWIRNVVKLSFVNLSIFPSTVCLPSVYSFNMLRCVHCTTVVVARRAMKFAHNLRMNQIYQWEVSVLYAVVEKNNKSSKASSAYFLLDDHFPFSVVHLLLSLLSCCCCWW